ncbi:serine/threonine-protein kinase [Streptomyces sp. CB02261]|uniref:serine/threonine-protein kinase n=1 Tax=Streptomyces sp. CB02261 TaxID=1703940 RepID=UPI00093AFBD2|nr:serine/threonine-protein kinase [Streptomyces sp. CB02261]OKJ67866.1 serine/threonine protein kinase [Streptomyces sp. CB02261]
MASSAILSRVGTLIGRYVIEHKLGEGGMGTVYLARSRGGRAVAVKVARPELAADPSFRARFRAEVAAARRVGGFHTAQVVDADPDAEAPWLATAYIPGPTLSALVTAEGPMDEARLRSLGAALAEALEAIHACGLVHRDLKPGNIVMAPDGPRVLDFGIARAVESTRLTATGSAFGTPGYLAPEQALGEEVTGAADVFALGAVLVAAAGGRPFGDGTPMGLMYRAVHEAPDLASVPESLRGLVGRCLAKQPADRPTPEQILDALGAEAETGAAADATPAAPADAVPASPADAAPASPAEAAPTPADAAPTPADAVPVSFDAMPTRTAGVQDAVPDSVPHPATLVVPPQPSLPPLPAPDFAAADRNSGIAVDAGGLSLHLFGEEAEFVWAEIGAVRYERIRRGRALRVSVHLYDGSVYDCEVDGRRAARVDEWILRLDPVLARYLPA